MKKRKNGTLGYGISPLVLLVGIALGGCNSQQHGVEPDHIEAARTYQVKAEITGLRNGRGVILSVLCVKGEAFPSQCQRRVRVDAVGPVILKYSAPRGEYALAAFHDEDSNGRIDVGPHGIPTEGVAFSNDAMSPTGPPAFEMSSFKVEADTRMKIKMVYFQ